MYFEMWNVLDYAAHLCDLLGNFLLRGEHCCAAPRDAGHVARRLQWSDQAHMWTTGATRGCTRDQPPLVDLRPLQRCNRGEGAWLPCCICTGHTERDSTYSVHYMCMVQSMQQASAPLPMGDHCKIHTAHAHAISLQPSCSLCQAAWLPMTSSSGNLLACMLGCVATQSTVNI